MTEAADTAPVFWRRILRPHRSLPPRGFHILMAVLALVSLAVGIGFIRAGAWPVCGFFGLDVALVWLAFRASYRSGRERQTIELAGGDVTVEHVSVRGEHRSWRFQAFWLQVRLLELGEAANRLLLTSHGRSLAIGGFLNADERRGLAGEIREAIARWKRGDEEIWPRGR